jgi:hypothetical protein
MGNGKRGKAPCGHDGEAVIGQYYQCLKGCDTGQFDVTVEVVRCVCGSSDIDPDFSIDPVYYWFNPGSPILDTRCNTCGKCWTRD